MVNKSASQHSPESGNITFIAIGLVVLMAGLLHIGALVADVALTQVRAHNVADAGALSAARALFDGIPNPCAKAEKIIRQADAYMTTCEVEETMVIIEISKGMANRWLLMTFGPVQIRAKAGF